MPFTARETSTLRRVAPSSVIRSSSSPADGTVYATWRAEDSTPVREPKISALDRSLGKRSTSEPLVWNRGPALDRHAVGATSMRCSAESPRRVAGAGRLEGQGDRLTFDRTPASEYSPVCWLCRRPSARISSVAPVSIDHAGSFRDDLAARLSFMVSLLVWPRPMELRGPAASSGPIHAEPDPMIRPGRVSLSASACCFAESARRLESLLWIWCRLRG